MSYIRGKYYINPIAGHIQDDVDNESLEQPDLRDNPPSTTGIGCAPAEPPASEPPRGRTGLMITPCERKMVECPDCHGLFAHGQASSSHTELRARLERAIETVPHRRRIVWKDGIDLEICWDDCSRCALEAALHGN